jgi:hypothetical protein
MYMASVTNPAWVEDVVWYPSDTVTVAVNGGAEVTASRFNRRGWYAPADGGNNRGVALSATAATNIIVKALDGGSERASVTQSITWTPTDLTGQRADFAMRGGKQSKKLRSFACL